MGILTLFKQGKKNDVKPEEKTIELKVCSQSEPAKRNKNPSDLDNEIESLHKDLAMKNDILERRNQAEKRFSQDGDVEAFLSFWRELWADGSCFKINGSWLFSYPELLIKEKRYDEAWIALNRLYLECPKNAGRIRGLQYKIAKAEGKHIQDAIYYLMASVLLGLEGSINPIDHYRNYEKTQFVKKMRPLAKKLDFGESEIEYLSYLIESSIAANQYSESSLMDAYEKFLLEKDLLVNHPID